jgi:3-phytase
VGGASGPRSSQRGRRCADGSRGGYLVASSQGDSTLHVVALDRGHEHLGSFGVAGVEETDAASADTDPINGFEHDGSTQWKFVQWEAVASAFRRPLAVDVRSHDPRRPNREGDGLGAFATSARLE